MGDQSTDVCFYSQNVRGTGSNKLQFIRDILSLSSRKIQIFCIQKHFLLRNNLYKLSNAFDGYAVISKPAFKDFHSVNSGRPMGGLATILPKNLRKFITLVNCNSWRLKPFTLKLGNETILIINTYFPTDPRTVTNGNVELIEVLAEIKALVEIQKFDSLLILGDINCDFLRNSNHVLEHL